MTNELGTKGTDTAVLKAALLSLLLHGLSLKDLCTPRCADTIQVHGRLSFLQTLQTNGGRKEKHSRKMQNKFNFNLLGASHRPLSCLLCIRICYVMRMKLDLLISVGYSYVDFKISLVTQ